MFCYISILFLWDGFFLFGLFYFLRESESSLALRFEEVNELLCKIEAVKS